MHVCVDNSIKSAEEISGLSRKSQQVSDLLSMGNNVWNKIVSLCRSYDCPRVVAFQEFAQFFIVRGRSTRLRG